MILFLRRWYIAVAIVWWLCGVAAYLLALHFYSYHLSVYLFWTLIPITVLIPAALLASRGFQRTTTGKMFLSIYAVVLIPMLIFAVTSVIGDEVRLPHENWTTELLRAIGLCLVLALEGGFIIAPVVLVVSFIVSALINLFSPYEAED